MSSNISLAILLLCVLIARGAAHPPGYTVNVTLPPEAFKDGAEKSSGGVLRATRGPCTCLDGICSCCTGVTMASIGQKGCVNLEYDPDDFLFVVSMSLNEKTLYKNVMSGKNPRPFCVPVPRLRFLQMCTKFSNVFLSGRNIHACIDMEGRILDTPMFSMSFDCVRVGSDGVAVLSPADGGGLPDKPPTVDEDYDQLSPDEDYDNGNESQHEDIYEPTPINLVTPASNSVKTTKSKPSKKRTTAASRRKTTATIASTTARTTTPITEKTTSEAAIVEVTSPRVALSDLNSTEPNNNHQKTVFRKPRE